MSVIMDKPSASMQVDFIISLKVLTSSSKCKK